MGGLRLNVEEIKQKYESHYFAQVNTDESYQTEVLYTIGFLLEKLEERAVIVEAFKLIALISNDENAVVTSQQTLEKVGELP